MKKGLLALLGIVLLIVVISMFGFSSSTGYVVDEKVLSQIDTILQEGKTAAVSTAPAGEAVQARTTTQDQQEKVITAITKLQRESTGNAFTRYVKSLSPFRDDADCDKDGGITMGDAACFGQQRNYKAVEQVFRSLYSGREPNSYDLSSSSLLSTGGSGDLEFIPLQTNSTNSTNSSGGGGGGGTFVAVCSTTFIRGNTNNDALIDLADVIYSLNFLFQLGNPPICGDIADTNDDNILDISDPVYTLAYLFGGGSAPFAPFPVAGYDEQGRKAGVGPAWNYCDGVNNDLDGVTDEGENCGTTNSTNATHLACVGLSCMPVAGGGPNLCTTSAQCVGNATNATTHLACVGQQCLVVPGIGPNLCTSSAQCVTNSTNSTNATHLACVGQACVPVAGAGPNLCTTSAQCITNSTNTTLPDLRVLSISHQVLFNVTNGSVVNVLATVINSGSANAGASITEYTQTIGTISSFFDLPTPSLLAGQQTVVNRTSVINHGVTVVTSFHVDNTFVVSESNELNNLLNYTFFVP